MTRELEHLPCGLGFFSLEKSPNCGLCREPVRSRRTDLLADCVDRKRGNGFKLKDG